MLPSALERRKWIQGGVQGCPSPGMAERGERSGGCNRGDRYRDETCKDRDQLFFLPEPLPFGGSTYLRLARLHVTIAAPYSGGIDPRLAVHARSTDKASYHHATRSPVQGQGPAWIPQQQTVLQQNAQARVPSIGCASIPAGSVPKSLPRYKVPFLLR